MVFHLSIFFFLRLFIYLLLQANGLELCHNTDDWAILMKKIGQENMEADACCFYAAANVYKRPFLMVCGSVTTLGPSGEYVPNTYSLCYSLFSMDTQ